MKVIRIDAYDREGPTGDKYLVREGLSAEAADRLVVEMNEDPGRPDEDWFRAVPDDHRLRTFEP
jgi:hypothetical protein